VTGVVRRGSLLLAFEQSPAGRRLIAVSVFVLIVAMLWPVLAGRRTSPEQTRNKVTV